MTSIIYMNNLKGGLVRTQYSFPLSISPFQMSSSPEKSAAFLDAVDFHCAEFSLNLRLWLQRRTVFDDDGLFLSPGGDLITETCRAV